MQQLKKDSEVSHWVWVKTQNYKINFHKNKHLYTFLHLDTFAYVLSFLSLFAIGYWFMLYLFGVFVTWDWELFSSAFVNWDWGLFS